MRCVDFSSVISHFLVKNVVKIKNLPVFLHNPPKTANNNSMKKKLSLLLGAVALTGFWNKTALLDFRKERGFGAVQTVVARAENDNKKLNLHAKSAYMIDAKSQTLIYAQNELTHLPIASMCKIMTLILCFDAIKNGDFTLDDTVKVSKNASSMGGSQVFLEDGGEYTVHELIKSIVVCSANDSCVAMAEKIAGSEADFTDKMNQKAKEIGAENTLFANCTGLPKEPQYSCAKDVATMLGVLTQNEEYFRFSKIWMDRFEHPKGRYTDISNTNKLIRFYDGCDGGKTGFTNQAGFCLAATACRGGMRVISVVIGEDSSQNRFNDMRSMFDYAFANYTLKTVVDGHTPLNEKVKVYGGKKDELTVRPVRSSHIFSKRGEKDDIQLSIKTEKAVKAPVKKGQKVGEIVVYKNGVEIDRLPIVADEKIGAANLGDRLKDIGENWDI